jgi:hypothetical protein
MVKVTKKEALSMNIFLKINLSVKKRHSLLN